LIESRVAAATPSIDHSGAGIDGGERRKAVSRRRPSRVEKYLIHRNVAFPGCRESCAEGAVACDVCADACLDEERMTRLALVFGSTETVPTPPTSVGVLPGLAPRTDARSRSRSAAACRDSSLNAPAAPGHLYSHGGGWVIADLECRRIAPGPSGVRVPDRRIRLHDRVVSRDERRQAARHVDDVRGFDKYLNSPTGGQEPAISGVTHGFFEMAPVVREAKEAQRMAADALTKVFGTA
jgi:hypothetical protein